MYWNNFVIMKSWKTEIKCWITRGKTEWRNSFLRNYMDFFLRVSKIEL